MRQMHRLLQAMRDAAALTELQPEVLNRWPAWQAGADLIASGQSDVITRLRLACAAMTSKQTDPAGLGEQLDRIDREAPVAKLAGRLTRLLGHRLRALPAGAPGTLAQLVNVPSDDAMLLAWRDDLARLCRYAAEAESARAEGRPADQVREIQAYVNALAMRLLEQTAKE